MAKTESIPPSLNKMTLADLLADRTGLARSVAYETVETLFDICARTVAQGGSVAITNFGSLELREKGPRAARNPHTGESITVPARKVVKFNVAPRLVEYANSPDPSATTIRKLTKGPSGK